MKNLLIYSCFLLVCCLTACKREATQPVDNSDSIAQGDTVHSTNSSNYIESLSEKKDTLITINGKEYTLECLTVMDTLKKVSYTVTYTAENGKVHKTDYNGFGVTYSISLSDASGNKLFSKTFTKADFENVVGNDALAQAIVEVPSFHGYHPGFNALMFTLDFMRPETDIGDQCFIMIDTNGYVIEKSFNNSYGGGGVDGTIEVPTDHSFVLTCAKVLHINGKVIDLEAGGKTLVHTKLINDRSVLVVYEREEGDTNDNARMIDNYGKVLKTFTYKGYYDMLGYVAPHYFEKTTGTYILLDDQNDNITAIAASNPLDIVTIPFATLRGAKTTTEHEITFDINTETSEQSFAIDTVTKAIRLIKQQQ